MSEIRRKNLRVLVPVGALLVAMSTLVIYSPTLYRVFCEVTGFGGTVQKVVAPPPTVADQMVTVSFDANVAPDLDWDFRPEQRKVKVRLGEPVKVYYTARNRSDEEVVARATFNVTPYKTAPYFFKIECFCFTEERLGPGESARMPLELYVDEELLKDPNAEEVRHITLSYTFFRQTELSAEEIFGARDLAAESVALDEKLTKAEVVEFDNDAPRR